MRVQKIHLNESGALQAELAEFLSHYRASHPEQELLRVETLSRSLRGNGEKCETYVVQDDASAIVAAAFVAFPTAEPNDPVRIISFASNYSFPETQESGGQVKKSSYYCNKKTEELWRVLVSAFQKTWHGRLVHVAERVIPSRDARILQRRLQRPSHKVFSLSTS